MYKYFDGPIKLFSDLHLAKFLNTLSRIKPFISCLFFLLSYYFGFLYIFSSFLFSFIYYYVLRRLALEY